MFSLFQSKSQQIRDLRLEVDTLKREFKNLQMDWTDLETRLRRRVASLARANQRALQVDELREEDTQPGGSGTGTSGEGNGSHPFSLTPGQRRIQAEILSRRGVKTNRTED